MTDQHPPIAAFNRLGLQVLERGWLSSNNIVFTANLARQSTASTVSVVDTGYVTHAAQTVQLLEHALAGHALQRVVNTHLHSDHCGGNAALQMRWPGCQTWVPAASLTAVEGWDEDTLTFKGTDQRCDRFQVQAGIEPGQTVRLGDFDWQVLAAPGHDPQAVVLFQPEERVLISGDALWRDGLAILFPELVGEPGFAPALQSLDVIEQLAPAWVIPGHGAAFADVSDSIDRSRQRLARFCDQPARHNDYAARALVMFHMLEVRTMNRLQLAQWILAVPLFSILVAEQRDPMLWAQAVINRLLQGGSLVPAGDGVAVAQVAG